MSFWWSTKTSSPKKNNVLESKGSFATFEQLTKDAWDTSEDRTDPLLIKNTPNHSNIDQMPLQQIHSPNKRANASTKTNMTNGNQSNTASFCPDHIGHVNCLHDDNLVPLQLSVSDANTTSITNGNQSNAAINSCRPHLSSHVNCLHDDDLVPLQLSIIDVNKMAEDIVRLHKLRLKDKTEEHQRRSVDRGLELSDVGCPASPELCRRQVSECVSGAVDNNNQDIVDNNWHHDGRIKNRKPAARCNSLGGGRKHGPGIGVRKKNLPSDKWSNNLEDEEAKSIKFSAMLETFDLDIDSLRKLSWSGIPMYNRTDVWKILCGYLPLNPERRKAVIERKRLEYACCVDQYFGTRETEEHKAVYHQIHIDIPRMQVIMKVFQQLKVQEMFERILYTWAIRHPASSYVQGINDLLVPFFVVYLSRHITKEEQLELFDISRLPASTIGEIEADSYWCLSRLLDGIQDNYTFAQPGIQRQVNLLKELIARLNFPLHEHLMTHQVEYLQFSFRWFNNLLMREIPLHCAIRLWDAFLSEENGFTQLHLFVCAAMLMRFSNEILKEEDFQGIMLFLGHLPTEHWTSTDISLLLADAHRLRYIFADTPSHYRDI